MFWNADRAMYLPSGFTISPSRGSSKMASALIFNRCLRAREISPRCSSPESELIVHSGHGAQYDPEAIREVERILKENLTDKN
jgi:hypothetical protein